MTNIPIQTGSPLVYIFVLFLIAAGLSGGVLPQYFRLKERGLHRLLALATGMLMGTVFYHMLPEALSPHGSPTLVLAGLLLVFVVERLVFSAGDPREPHAVIGATAFFGLSVHAVIVGLGLASQLANPLTQVLLMSSLLVHKFSETFALSSVFLLAGYSRGRSLQLIALFSCLTPASLIIGHCLLLRLPAYWVGTASGLAAGTFLYVALVDLLPEVFHQREGRWLSLGVLLVGIAIIAALITFGGHPHH